MTAVAAVVVAAPCALRADGSRGDPVRHVVVGGTDTLWGIADEVRRDGASIEETMRAIVRANPHAFTDGDPGQLRAGARLALPWAAEPAEEGQANVAAGEGADAVPAPMPAVNDEALDRLTTENAALRAEVARSAEAHEQVASERDRLLEENASLRAQEATGNAAVAEVSGPQSMPAAGRRPFLPVAAVALILGMVLGAGGSAGWRRWRRRASPATRKEPHASSLSTLATRVRNVATPAAAAGAGESSAAPASPATPEELDAAISAAEGDPATVKLELARAYMDIGDTESAVQVLKEVSEQGNPEQRAAAAELLKRL